MNSKTSIVEFGSAWAACLLYDTGGSGPTVWNSSISRFHIIFGLDKKGWSSSGECLSRLLFTAVDNGDTVQISWVLNFYIKKEVPVADRHFVHSKLDIRSRKQRAWVRNAFAFTSHIIRNSDKNRQCLTSTSVICGCSGRGHGSKSVRKEGLNFAKRAQHACYTESWVIGPWFEVRSLKDFGQKWGGGLPACEGNKYYLKFIYWYV